MEGKIYKLIIIIVSVLCQIFAQNDTTAPELTYFSFTPHAVDVTLGPDTVSITLGGMDDLSGLYYGKVTTRSELGLTVFYRSRYVNFEYGSLSDTLSDIIIVDQYVNAGDWTIDKIALYDTSSNFRSYYSSELESMGFPTTLTVNSITDTRAPELTYFSFTPSSVDVTSSPDTISFTISGIDDRIGLWFGRVSFSSPSDSGYVDNLFWFDYKSLSDTLTNIIIIDQNAEVGDWTINNIKIADWNYNLRRYEFSELESMGFPTTFTVGNNLSTTNKKTNIDIFELYQNYPNPFNPITNIQFDIPESAEISLKIFNISGQLVYTPIEKKQYEAGTYNFSLDLGHLTNGVYIYSLENNDLVVTKKMVLLK